MEQESTGLGEPTAAIETESKEGLLERLASLPEREVLQTLERAASERGPETIPLLEELATAGGGDVPVAAARALGSIRDGAAAAALQRLGAGSTRIDVRKAARRELHRLASLGIVAAAAPSRPEGKRAVTQPVYRALASFVDGRGNRGLWVGLDAGADVDFLALLTNEEKGIVDAHITDISRSRFDREVREVLEDPYRPWIELPVDYLRHLVEEAHSRNRASRTSIPLEYLAWRDRLGRPEQQYTQPLIYSVVNAAEVRWDPRFLDGSGSLLNMKLFQSWIFEPGDIEEFVRETALTQQSGLVLAGVDPRHRERTVVDKAVQKLFDARRRSLFKGRLEEMAYLLWVQDRGYQARVALAAALGLEPPDRSLQGHPFARALVEWSLEVLGEQSGSEHVREVKPGVQIHLPY